MYTKELSSQAIIRQIEAGAATRHRIAPVESARTNARRAAVTRALDWLPMVALAAAGAASGIIRIAQSLHP